MISVGTIFKIVDASLTLGERVYRLFKKKKPVTPLTLQEVKAVAKSSVRLAGKENKR